MNARPIRSSNRPRPATPSMCESQRVDGTGGGERQRVDSDWAYRILAEVPSTNSYVAHLPPWTAVRAITQSAGRGRTPDRHWVSDEGGLWLSAVLPCPGPRSQWAILPLVAGWAVLKALGGCGVSNARLRWPNDIMVGTRKLAGVLVERFAADTAVVGIGVNVFNHPEAGQPALTQATARVADLAPGVFTVEDVSRQILRELRAAHAMLVDTGFQPIADELNQLWAEPRRVAVTFTGHPTPVVGLFLGIDDAGRLCLQTPQADLQIYDATEVSLLRELE